MVARLVTPWQVWWVDFTPQVVREQTRLRPAVVVGTALACSLPNGLALVVPCTSTDRRLPFHPAITLGERAGVAMCDQLKSVSLDRFVRPHQAGTLAEEERATVSFVLGQLVAMSAP